nr:hypothetical protein CFP56_79522 [Quercus suber]
MGQVKKMVAVLLPCQRYAKPEIMNTIKKTIVAPSSEGHWRERGWSEEWPGRWSSFWYVFRENQGRARERPVLPLSPETIVTMRISKETTYLAFGLYSKALEHDSDWHLVQGHANVWIVSFPNKTSLRAEMLSVAWWCGRISTFCPSTSPRAPPARSWLAILFPSKPYFGALQVTRSSMDEMAQVSYTGTYVVEANGFASRPQSGSFVRSRSSLVQLPLSGHHEWRVTFPPPGNDPKHASRRILQNIGTADRSSYRASIGNVIYQIESVEGDASPVEKMFQLTQ